MTQSGQSEQLKNGPSLNETQLTQAVVEIIVPANYDYLAILGAVAREFCAALPLLLPQSKAELDTGVRRFGTGILKLPGSTATVTASYSHFVYSVELVLQEVASNIVRHGYGEGSVAQIHLSLSVEEVSSGRNALIISIKDDAPAFDPTLAQIEPPDPHDPRESGYGLYLIHKLTDQLEYTRQDGWNYLRMTKYL